MKKTLIVIFVIFVTGGYFFWQNQIAPVASTDKHQEIFVVEKGKGIKAIAHNLAERKLIKNETVFYMLIKLLGIENKIQAGSFRLSPSLSSEQIAKDLTSKTLDVWITISEGKRAEEIADILEKSIPTYNQSWRKQMDSEEGYLFPDTYLIPIDATIDQIISIMRNNFTQKYSTLTFTRKGSQAEIITVASLIEREAKHDQDRPLVASVIYNRLDLGMPLQIDATIQYLLGYQPRERSWWKRHLTIDDLAIRSAYNTYKNTGLPPGPIANPGLESLKAAANPTDTAYLYYISDTQGNNHYAKTNAEHEGNIQKYGL